MESGGVLVAADGKIDNQICRSIYKMVQLYETYSSPSFTELIIKIRPRVNPVEKEQNQKSQIMPIELAQLQSGSIVPIELAQIPPELLSTGWSNHQLIMNNCKTNEQRLFYMMYAGREHLEYKELERAIKTDAMSAVLGGKDVQSKVMQTKYPRAPLLFKDRVSLDMLGLPLNFKETKLRKAIVSHMKEHRSNENPSIGILFNHPTVTFSRHIHRLPCGFVSGCGELEEHSVYSILEQTV